MTIMLTENVSPSIRGELSRWLIEVKPGVFLGNMNALVREEIWNYFMGKIGEESTLIQIWTTNNEQGFDLRSHNTKNYEPIECEGIWLIRKP